MRQKTFYCLSGFSFCMVFTILFVVFSGVLKSSGFASDKLTTHGQILPHNMRQLNGDLPNIREASARRNESDSQHRIQISNTFRDIQSIIEPVINQKNNLVQKLLPAKEASSNTVLLTDGKVRNCISGQVVYESESGGNARNMGSYADIELSNRTRIENPDARKDSFDAVFQQKVWGGERAHIGTDEIRGSGPGSTLDFSQEAIGTLHALINALKAKLGKETITFLDIPCGDMAWIGRFLETRDDILYTGMDIVPDIIAHHKRVYSGNRRFKFISGDVLDASVNLEKYDLILSRMMMQHLYDADVQKMLKKISQSGSKYLLMTTFVHLTHNTNLGNTLSYRFRPQNLQILPFNLTLPICLQRDGPPLKDDHYLGLWELPLAHLNDCRVHGKTSSTGQLEQFYVC